MTFAVLSCIEATPTYLQSAAEQHVLRQNIVHVSCAFFPGRAEIRFQAVCVLSMCMLSKHQSTHTHTHKHQNTTHHDTKHDTKTLLTMTLSMTLTMTLTMTLLSMTLTMILTMTLSMTPTMTLLSMTLSMTLSMALSMTLTMALLSMTLTMALSMTHINPLRNATQQQSRQSISLIHTHLLTSRLRLFCWISFWVAAPEVVHLHAPVWTHTVTLNLPPAWTFQSHTHA